jgi:IS5 family transposase
MKARNAKHIEVHIHHAALEKTAGREKTWVFKRTLAERQWKMEGIFAEAKDNHGLDRARYRGRSKMQIQAYLIASVQNLKRLAGHLPAIAAALQESAAGTLEVFSSTFFQRNTDLKLQFYFF